MKSIRKLNLKLFFLVLILFISISFLVKRHCFSNKEYTIFDTGKVVAVYDGDTIKVKYQNGQAEKVRLIGVNCPELENDREEVRYLAQVAKRFTFYFLFNKKIKLTYDEQFRDKYGRVLAYVWLEDSTFFNNLIIREGFAFVFLRYPFKEEYQKMFRESEEYARLNNKGLWSVGQERIVSLEECFSYIGEYLSVKFRCQKVYYGKKYIFLDSSLDYRHNFSALIIRFAKARFGNIKKFEGRTLVVTGFLEKYKNKPQIVVFSPLQIKIIS